MVEAAGFSVDHALMIVNLRRYMSANSYKMCIRDRYVFNIKDNELLRFLRDIYGKRSISELSDEERNVTAQELFRQLCEKYEVVVASDSSKNQATVLSSTVSFLKSQGYMVCLLYTSIRRE